MNQYSVYLLNLGCAKNQVDSEKILGEFKNSGFDICNDSQAADVVIINTCGFINDAKEESIHEIFNAVEKKKTGQVVIAAGCFSQRYMDTLKVEIPEVDFFTGVYQPSEILSLLKKRGYPCVIPETSSANRVVYDQKPHHAFLKISEGCSRKCSFCAIPKIRGKQVSRISEEIISEACELESRGVKEISLIAQDLTFYGYDLGIKDGLNGLLKGLIANTGIEWFRLMYAYPANISESLLELISLESRICNYLDIPVQHSSSNVLKHMRRGYNGKELRKIIQNLRSNVPDIALRSTLLVGHPGESDKDFEDLLGFVEEYKFERLGGFTYSEEEDTHAFTHLQDLKVQPEIAKKRLSVLMDLQQKISMEINAQKVGNIYRVLIDNPEKDHPGFNFAGRTEADAPDIDNEVLIKGTNAVPGEFCDVKITNAWEFDLEGEII